MSLTVTCPECGAVHVPAEITQRAGPVNDRRRGQVTLLVAKCPNCEMHYALYRDSANRVAWWEPRSARAEVPAGVPASIGADYKEGQLALGYGLQKSAAVMFRRAVQGAAIEKGAPADKNLRDEIDWLAANNRITNDMKEWAHELRLFGNAGAHPGDDLLESVSEADANDAFAFAKAFLDYLYVLPDRIAKARQSRAAP